MILLTWTLKIVQAQTSSGLSFNNIRLSIIITGRWINYVDKTYNAGSWED
jgi:hypothetical protein